MPGPVRLIEFPAVIAALTLLPSAARAANDPSFDAQWSLRKMRCRGGMGAHRVLHLHRPCQMGRRRPPGKGQRQQRPRHPVHDLVKGKPNSYGSLAAPPWPPPK